MPFFMTFALLNERDLFKLLEMFILNISVTKIEEKVGGRGKTVLQVLTNSFVSVETKCNSTLEQHKFGGRNVLFLIILSIFFFRK